MDYIKKYFNNISDLQYQQFANLQELYTNWNNKINVISRKDIDQLTERHVLHSLAIAKYTTFADNTNIIDVGTGGGFPGIPLAILFPNANFTLVDSIAKKIKVVEGVASELGLQNVKAYQSRSEEVKDKFDFVVSRAVTAFPDFVKMTRHLVETKKAINHIKNGILYLKGGDFDNELKAFGRNATVTPLTDYYEEEFFETKKLIHLAL